MKRTGDEQAKNDNLTVEEVSINFNLDDLDFSFDDFEIDLDIDLSFDDFNFDFLNAQKPTRRTNRERTESEQRENAKINCERTVRTKHERSPRKTILKSRGSRERSQEEAKRKPRKIRLKR